jgi:hypothetical protein
MHVSRKRSESTMVARAGPPSLGTTAALTNPSSNPGPLTNVSYTDTLPAGLEYVLPSLGGPSCLPSPTGGGDGVTTLTYFAPSIPPGSSNCTVEIGIKGTSPGVKTDVTSEVTSDQATGSSATATVTVVAAPPVISTGFGAATLSLGGMTSLNFTIENPNSTATLTGVGFTDHLPSGLLVSTPNGLAGSCGGGTVTATAGGESVSLSGATLTANASCTFSVNLTATSTGTKTNTVAATSTESGTAPGPSATAVLAVVAPDLSISSSQSGAFKRGRNGT